jgi:hypothetical protein
MLREGAVLKAFEIIAVFNPQAKIKAFRRPREG